MAELITLADLRGARGRVAGAVVRTGLYRVDAKRLRAVGMPASRCEIWVKAESEQPIGSFKLRGAYNRIAQLSQEELRRGVITYSSGNHAQGVGYAARALGAKAVIVMPESAPKVKIEATRALGAEVVFVGASSTARREKAEELAAAHGYAIIPPYDDLEIIAGQGTCGLEILEQLGELPGVAGKTVIVAPVSGGGLLGGIAAAVKLSLAEVEVEEKQVLRLRAARSVQDDNPQKMKTTTSVEVWGAEPELAGDAAESFASGRLVEWPAEKTTRTLADGLRTQSLGARNFSHVMRYVDGIVTVSEEEIRRGMIAYLTATELVAEPSGAVTLAAALFRAGELPECGRMVVVLSGGNIDTELRRELEREAGLASAAAAAGV